MRILVNQLNQLTGKEIICFTQIDEQTSIARSSGTASATFSSVGTPAIGSRCFNFLSVTVILQEAIKLNGNHAFNDIFLAQPFQFTVNSGHKVLNLFLVNLDLLDVINNLDELLLADLLSGRHFTGNEFFGNDTLYFT
ncbi:hypothetical protein SDC9_155814 [bioreactor metagenome]|uniref:Uncharacterized protein n=1 Tax=bioreactor metagenome TaxID=1076179 RepID=A0A645F2Q2_9ZZZZ